MKNSLRKWLFITAAVCGWTTGALAAVLTVTPGTITNDYVGKITLTITGLTPGQAVVAERYGDFNTNGVIDAGEPVLQGGVIIDGALPTIGGVRNLNVPGDEDGSENGQVRMELFYPGAEKGLAVIAGRYLIKVSDPASGFAPVTNSFEIKQKVFPQGVSGRITALGTGIPLANAPVVLLPPDSDPVTGTVTDADGNYTLHSPPGNYMVLPLAPGFVGDFNGGVTVSASAFAAVNLALPAASRTISGRLKDSSSGLGLPGVFIQADSASGQFVSAFSQSDGTYSVGVLSDNWMLEPSSGSLALLGYLGWNNGTNVNATSGNVANLDLPVDQATALIYGTVKNNQNNPVIGVGIWSDDQNQQYDTSGSTFPPNAAYCVGVRPGNWWVGPDSDALIALGYIGQGTNVTLSANQALRVNFGVLPVNAHLIGRVVDNLGAPVGNIGFSADDHQGVNSYVNTDDNGGFDIGVSGGTWYLQLSTDDAQQRQLVSPQLQITLTNGETRSNIVLVAQHATAQISGYVRDASATPIANVAVYGSATVNGTNYSDYARTGANGDYQLRAFNGTWQVSLECYDLQSHGYSCANSVQTSVAGANVTLNFTVEPLQPLQMTTTSLPGGIVGVYYDQSLGASGGQPPYWWWLPDGTFSLPPGTFGDMNFSNDGTISGIPGRAGTFSFWVGVSDNGSPPNVVTQMLSITIQAAGSPLQVTTTSLPNGTRNTFYNQPVNATGGQQPYTWSLAPGSAPLPPGLGISNGGAISGTPTNSGTFYFNVRVTDALSATADGLVSIYIPTPPLQITTLSLPNAQQGATYTNQLQASGGQPPYGWSLAPGSLGLPPNLNLSSSGVISGTAATNGTFFFIVRVTDANSTFINRSLGLTINPKPTLTALNRTGNQFQLRLTGATGQNYTVQFSTNPANSNWSSLLITNPTAASVTILDPNATNSARYYRARVEP